MTIVNVEFLSLIAVKFRFKLHILSKRGEVTGCPNATREVIAKIRDVDIVKKKEKVHRGQIDLMYAAADFDGESGGDEDIEVHEVEADVIVPSKRKFKGITLPTPFYYHIRSTLFNMQLEEMKKFVETFRPHWKRFGCSIMSDGWTNGKGRHLINFVVNCPKGSVFLKSVDASSRTNDQFYIAELVNELIEDVGIGKRFVTYNYAHFQVLDLIREMTGKKELHRSAKTRFGTQYYTLDSLLEHKNALQMMFVNEKWTQSSVAKEVVGKMIVKIVASGAFWAHCDFSCKVLKPLVDVVRMVDIELKPTIGVIYEVMRLAREKLQIKFREDKGTLDKIMAIINERWEDQLDHPLHAATWYLNPFIFYKISQEEMDNISKYAKLKRGLLNAMENLKTDNNEHDKAIKQLRLYSDAYGALGTRAEVRSRDTTTPYDWWITYGGMDVPELQKFAIKVLSQTCSASSCERNWSTFGNMHTKRRNRFLQQKLNDCVYIQYNKKLQRKYEEIQRHNSGGPGIPIFLDALDEEDNWLDPENLSDLLH
ncbi:uncharacterized protein LOC113294418 [Papaver somniferum]|uniref:uncharacterized protein LOC113294418 n=1 Tax=Papaver somniferum TaxID=3469 RepID=UPI000E6F9C7C|nr:uncharacterized protein LOC113294418 [Papaver somniferum]